VVVGDELRRSIRAKPPSEIRSRLRVPPGALLSFGVGIEKRSDPRERDGVVFEVDVAAGDLRHTLFSRSLEPNNPLSAHRWFDEQLSLAPYAGHEIDLVFRTSPLRPNPLGRDSSGDLAVWSNPTVFVPRSAQQRHREPDVVLVTVDTLRPDHLSCYGYPRDTSPAIARLAEDGVLFENAYTTMPRTLPALASMMTGLYPMDHGARTMLHEVDAGQTTLAELMKQQGYATGAVVTSNASRRTGLHQGFDTFADHFKIWVYDKRARAERLAARAAEWIARHEGQKFFFWLHLWDPHFLYMPPPPYGQWFDPDFRGVFDLYQRLAEGEVTPGQVYFQNDLSARQVRHAIALYDGEIRYTDWVVGQFLDRLRTLGL
jgi:hypothetical protein